ncbi:MAG: helix-turn-helix domain-containing protein [Chloroflexi bacterium]|nr:helix-turn-helix domain-containing protein [Chloroflexota bacterium]
MVQTAASRVLTVQETADALGISLNSAYEGIRRGDIPHLRIGRRIVVPMEALERLLATA